MSLYLASRDSKREKFKMGTHTLKKKAALEPQSLGFLKSSIYKKQWATRGKKGPSEQIDSMSQCVFSQTKNQAEPLAH